MQTVENDPVAHAADGLAWAITTQRWLRSELQRMEDLEAAGEPAELVLDREGVQSLIAGAAGISEVLADYLRAPGVLVPFPARLEAAAGPADQSKTRRPSWLVGVVEGGPL